MSEKTANIAGATRFYRKLHKWIAVPLFCFLFLIGITGLLLGWKKHAGILPPTEKGTNTDPDNWIGLDSIHLIAVRYAESVLNRSGEIDRIDIRPAKGIAKIVFVDHFCELQIDCSTGKILSVNTRTSDFIEKIHDGSILDFWIKTGNDPIKLVYTTASSIGLILLSFSGFWLWYNPIRMRKRKKKSSVDS